MEQGKPPYPIDIRLLCTDTIVLDAQPGPDQVQELRFTGRDGDRLGIGAHGTVSGNRKMSRIMTLSKLLYIYTPSRCLCKHLEGAYF
jgi:hypothetical protein